MPVSRLTSVSSQKYSSSHSMRQHINELVVTDGEQIICVPPQKDIQLAASLGSEKSHALAMFQALTGCDTASVLSLLDMDRKLHGMPAMELIARACYTACALTDIQEHKRAALMYVQSFHGNPALIIHQEHFPFLISPRWLN